MKYEYIYPIFTNIIKNATKKKNIILSKFAKIINTYIWKTLTICFAISRNWNIFIIFSIIHKLMELKYIMNKSFIVRKFNKWFIVVSNYTCAYVVFTIMWIIHFTIICIYWHFTNSVYIVCIIFRIIYIVL